MFTEDQKSHIAREIDSLLRSFLDTSSLYPGPPCEFTLHVADGNGFRRDKIHSIGSSNTPDVEAKYPVIVSQAGKYIFTSVIVDADLTYKKGIPTQSGWYWCRNAGDKPGEIWEAVCYVSVRPSEFINKPDIVRVSWMKSPGEVGVMHRDDISEDCLWAGPLKPRPSTTDVHYAPPKP